MPRLIKQRQPLAIDALAVPHFPAKLFDGKRYLKRWNNHMLSEQDLIVLRDFFNDFAATSQTIVGARIGDNVKKLFPELNVKAAYGSLQKLIEQHFSDVLELTGAHGNDKEYSFISQTPSSPDKDALPNVPAPQKINSIPRQHQISDAAFRQAIKNAIDTMTLEQLRQLALPAGILLDAINNTRTM